MKKNPALDVAFGERVDETLRSVAATETLWLTAPPASDIRTRLKVSQLEALYEAAYLRIFSAWEAFLEDVLTRLMAGYRTSSHSPMPPHGKALEKSVKLAQVSLYRGRAYLLWHDPRAVADRAGRHVVSSPLEAVIRSEQSRLEIFASIRHKIAHDSDDAKRRFRIAAVALCGNTFSGRPGKLLRGADLSDPLNQPKWIRVISYELVQTASSMLA